MAKWFNISAAAFALAAAVFWFLSAAGKMPPMAGYWDKAPETDPFYVALKFSAKMNTIAAVLSGFSALSVFGAAWTR